MPAKLQTPDAIEFRNLLQAAGEALLPGENVRGRNGKGAERRRLIADKLNNQTGDTIPVETIRRWEKGYTLPLRADGIARALRLIIATPHSR